MIGPGIQPGYIAPPPPLLGPPALGAFKLEDAFDTITLIPTPPYVLGRGLLVFSRGPDRISILASRTSLHIEIHILGFSRHLFRHTDIPDLFEICMVDISQLASISPPHSDLL